ncbi:hypothetical protein [Variovorax sp. YR216]|uniref:hypothetical protein n=1 Tax=Variovorax sp. YR216 TaxID=1882828 RepID=UPI0008994857|nr:hypothetical protein [Variovorax sp. YR216]SEA54210.1 hypothetical protein SAMN05444680_102833 [Variovorax sp. YR216]
MSTQNISSAALHVVGQYNDAGKTLVNAWRAGAHRLLGGATSRYGSFLAKRVDIEHGRVVALMDRFAEAATSGIESVAKAAARVEAPLSTSVIDAITRIHQPIASASVKIADTVAAGAKKIESRVAGTAEAESEVQTPKAKPAARRRASAGSRALKA